MIGALLARRSAAAFPDRLWMRTGERCCATGRGSPFVPYAAAVARAERGGVVLARVRARRYRLISAKGSSSRGAPTEPRVAGLFLAFLTAS
jgi:hypothetical protein